uniref:Cadherin domain-containing protein n=1 Tax=Callorhinchus milii TaxID=7868 RepID=A0A4W3JTE8_CALMI
MANALRCGPAFILLLFVSDLVSGQIHYSIPEELEQGAFVGNIVRDLGLNVEKLLVRKFRLVSDDSRQYLKVNFENGILFVNERIDREELCGQSPTCSLSFEAAVDNPLEVHPIEVEIVDINDNSPRFPRAIYSLHIFESILPGGSFPLESAHDSDVGVNTIINYRISSDEHFSLKVQTRNDGSKIVELLLEKVLDRERESAFQLVLTAIDGGNPQRSGTAEISITVVDMNDNAPVFDHETYSTSIQENTPKGTVVIQINAVDLDSGANAEVKYSFSSHSSDRGRKLFQLDSETGEIKVQSVLNFEVANVYELYVQATDKGTTPMAGHAKVVVKLIDVNDNAPEIKLRSISRVVPEDVTLGTVVAVISVTDRDSGENGEVHCTVPMNIPFGLQKSPNNQYKLVVGETLDREKESSYNISILAWDGGTPPLSANRTILVTVSDVNDNAPEFTQSSYNVYLMENNTPGASIFAMTALDPDVEQNGEISYSVVESQIQDVTATAYISVSSKSGNIYALRSFDYEQLKHFQIKVQAQDGGFPPLSNVAFVNVIILDQNDNAPFIVSPVTRNNSTAVEIPLRSTYPGYLVTKVLGTDADSGQNARLSYQLMDATDPSLFSVGLLTGEIRTLRRLLEEDATTQSLVILLKDNGQPSLSSTATLLFSLLSNVTDIVLELSDRIKTRDRFSHLNLYAIVGLGSTSLIFLVTIILLVAIKCKQDRNITGGYRCTPASHQSVNYSGVGNSHVSYSILENPIQGMTSFPYVSIDSKSGNIYALRSFDYERLKHFQIQVQARDSGSPSLSSSAAVNVIILDQNDNAPAVVSPVTRNGSATVGPVPQSAPAGYLVTKVMATDADSGQNARLSYQLRKATDPSLISVGLKTGEIKLIRSVSSHDATTQDLLISVNDNGQPTLSATVTIAFSIVANVTEKYFERSNVLENANNFSDLNLYLIITLGSTSFIFLLTIMVFCCCRMRDSGNSFMRRSAPKECLNYTGVRDSVPIPGSYNYRFSVSPDSSKTDFLFLKTYAPTLPHSTLKMSDNNMAKERGQEDNGY